MQDLDDDVPKLIYPFASLDGFIEYYKLTFNDLSEAQIKRALKELRRVGLIKYSAKSKKGVRFKREYFDLLDLM